MLNFKTDFGATGQSTLADAPCWQTAFNAMAATGQALYVPAGRYLCDVRPTFSGNSFRMVGDGPLTEVVFTAPNCGFDTALVPQGVNRPPEHAYVSDMRIELVANLVNPALRLAWTDYQPNAQGQFRLTDVDITRGDNGLGSAPVGIQVQNGIGGKIEGSWIVGDDARLSGVGIELIDCVGVKVEADVNRYKTGVRTRVVVSAGNEGITLRDCALYDVFRGVDAQNTLALALRGCHININGAGDGGRFYDVNLAGCNQVEIDGGDYYFGGLVGGPGGHDGIVLENSNEVLINPAFIEGITKANTLYAIALVGSCSNNRIGALSIVNATNGILNNSIGTNNTLQKAARSLNVTNKMLGSAPMIVI